MDVASRFVSCESKRGKIISESDFGFFPILVRKAETAQMMIGMRASPGRQKEIRDQSKT